jgi:hypothetical protein
MFTRVENLFPGVGSVSLNQKKKVILPALLNAFYSLSWYISLKNDSKERRREREEKRERERGERYSY